MVLLGYCLPTKDRGYWDLGFGFWDLGFGVWCLVFGFWN